MPNLLEAIRGFAKSALKPADTIITARDGTQFHEKRTRDGKSVLTKVGHVNTPAYLRDAKFGKRTISPYEWKAGRWERTSTPANISAFISSTKAASNGAVNVRIATWNVWFAEWHKEARAKQLIRELESCQADIVCLQEVTEQFMHVLLGTPWIRDTFIVSDNTTATTVAPYGVAILIKKEWNSVKVTVRDMALHDIVTNMGRRLLMARMSIARPDGKQVVLNMITAHFESLSNREIRESQLTRAFALLEEASACEKLVPTMSIVLGDFNYPDGSPEQRVVPAEYEDIGLDSQATRQKSTCDGWRLDRVMFKCKNFKARESKEFEPVKLLGTEATSIGTDGVYPSDHKGIFWKLNIPQALFDSEPMESSRRGKGG